MIIHSHDSWSQISPIPTHSLYMLKTVGSSCEVAPPAYSAHQQLCCMYKDVLFSHDGHIKAVFLPPNTTSVFQPLIGSKLETYKHNYHKLLLQSVIAENEWESSPCWRPSNKSDIVYIPVMVKSLGICMASVKDIETSRLSFPRVSHSCTFYSMYGGWEAQMDCDPVSVQLL